MNARNSDEDLELVSKAVVGVGYFADKVTRDFWTIYRRRVVAQELKSRLASLCLLTELVDWLEDVVPHFQPMRAHLVTRVF